MNIEITKIIMSGLVLITFIIGGVQCQKSNDIRDVELARLRTEQLRLQN